MIFVYNCLFAEELIIALSIPQKKYPHPKMKIPFPVPPKVFPYCFTGVGVGAEAEAGIDGLTSISTAFTDC